MYKAYDKLKHKVIIGTWEDVCNLDTRCFEVAEVFLNEDGEEMVPKPKLLATLSVKTIKGGTRNINVYGIGDTDGIYLGGNNNK